MTDRQSVAGLVLAGGEARRMGGEAKAFVPLAGRPMVDYVLQRITAQVHPCWLAVGQGDARFARYALPMFEDRDPQARGPLAGLQAGLEQLQAQGLSWLVLSPCDAPFLPLDLVERLLDDVQDGDRVLLPALDDQPHPTFSAWHVETLEAVRTALATRGGAGLMAVLRSLPHREITWNDGSDPSPFFNVNTPAELASAERHLVRETLPSPGVDAA